MAEIGTYWVIGSTGVDPLDLERRLTGAAGHEDVVVVDPARRPLTVTTVRELPLWFASRRLVTPGAVESFRQIWADEPEARHIGILEYRPQLYLAADRRAIAVVRGRIDPVIARLALDRANDIPGIDPDVDHRVRYLCLPGGGFVWLDPGLDGQPCPDGDGILLES